MLTTGNAVSNPISRPAFITPTTMRAQHSGGATAKSPVLGFSRPSAFGALRGQPSRLASGFRAQNQRLSMSAARNNDASSESDADSLMNRARMLFPSSANNDEIVLDKDQLSQLVSLCQISPDLSCAGQADIPPRAQQILQQVESTQNNVDIDTLIAKQEKLGATDPITDVLIWNTAMSADRALAGIQTYSKRLTGDAHAIKAFSVVSDDDADAKFRSKGDKEIRISGKVPTETFLNLDKFRASIRAAKAEVATDRGPNAKLAVMVGWGFISEYPEAREIADEEGVVFIGPTAKSIAELGDKARAKEIAKSSNVPTIPGSKAILNSVAEAKQLAAEYGYPVLLKARSGGGGKGMREVQNESEMEKMFKETQQEAVSSFNDPGILLEKFLVGNRHIEFQIIADKHDNVVILGERDCSAQNHHQKVFETSAEHTVPLDHRRELRKAVAELARQSGYQGAGTAEFLYNPTEKAFYFLEVNTRLQVEHPVTEQQRDVDLVALQLAIGAGMKLDDIFSSQQLDDFANNDPGKHTIAVRITADNTWKGQTSTGTVEQIHTPQNIEGMRYYFSVAPGSKVTGNNDRQIGHVFITAPTREETIARMSSALEQLTITGVETNVDFAKTLLESDEFRDNEFDTKFLESEFIPRYQSEMRNPPNLDVAIIAEGIKQYDQQQGELADAYTNAIETETHLPQMSRTAKISIDHLGNSYDLSITKNSDESYSVNGVNIQKVEQHGGRAKLSIEGNDQTYSIRDTDDGISVNQQQGISFGDFTSIKSPCDSAIRAVHVEPGSYVEEGQPIFTYEAAKKFTEVFASFSGTVEKIGAKLNEMVTKGTEVVKFAPPEDFKAAKRTELPIAPATTLSLGDAITRLDHGEQLSQTCIENCVDNLDPSNPEDIANARIGLAKFLVQNRALKRPADRVSAETQYLSGNANERLTFASRLAKRVSSINPTTLPAQEQPRFSKLLQGIIHEYRRSRNNAHKELVADSRQALSELDPKAVKSAESKGSLSTADAKRLAQVERGQVYVYDIPEKIVSQIEAAWASAVGSSNVPDLGKLVEFEELTLRDPSNEKSGLVSTDQSDGSNLSSVVIWKAKLHLPGESEPRQVIWGANDFTVQAGSMDLQDDNLYAAAANQAVKENIPFIFYFNGAGARMVPNIEVGEKAQPVVTPNGKELILSREDYLYLKESVSATPITVGSEVFYRIDNLHQKSNQASLSGAGKTVAASIDASQHVPTFGAAIGTSIVGKHSYAYEQLEDNVQQESCSILLTGSGPINAALNKKAYANDKQIGGTEIHGQSSVSAWKADDFDGVVEKTVQWLGYQNSGAMTQAKINELRGNFEDRDVEAALFDPQNGKPPVMRFDAAGNVEAYDVRDLIGSIVDENSFMEGLADFAPNIVTGYAKVGELPVGVIAFEPGNTQTKRAPDPAAPTPKASREQVLPGRVWDKDASEKTARWIRRMNWNDKPLVMIPNIRGFKGDTSALLDRVIASGSEIARQLRSYESPVVVYVPPHAQLRGGAWVVIDRNINDDKIHFLVDKKATLGVLEPSMALTTPKVKRAIAADAKKMGQEAAAEKWTQLAVLGDDPEVAVEDGNLNKAIDTKSARREIFDALLKGYEDQIS